MTPYPYQVEARNAVFNEFNTGIQSTLLIMATGTGKTVTFAITIDQMQALMKQEGLPTHTVVLAHREELLTQAAEKLQAWAPHLSVDIEQGERRVDRVNYPDIIVASVPSLSRPKRLQQFDPLKFGFIITDEAHHSPAETYQAIYRQFAHCWHLGVTATSDRTDEVALGTVFESVAFSYDLRTAIEQERLVPIFREAVIVEGLDFAAIDREKKDFEDEALQKQFLAEGPLHKVADTIVRIAHDEGRPRQVVAFCPGVDHAEVLADIISKQGKGTAQAITAKTSNRQAVLNAFRDGSTQILTNYNVLTEGTDLPMVEVIANCRPTKSRLVYAQMVGRGTRLNPPDKTRCLVIDFTDASGRHDLISPIDIFDGNMDVQIKIRAEEIMKRKPNTGALDALLDAEEEIGREKQLALAKKMVGKANYSRVQIDAFTVIGVSPRKGRWLGQPLTRDQATILKYHKIPTNSLDRGEAEQVIQAIRKRQERGLPSPRQSRVLIRAGFDPNVPSSIANAQIDYIKRRNYELSFQDRFILQRMAGEPNL